MSTRVLRRRGGLRDAWICVLAGALLGCGGHEPSGAPEIDTVVLISIDSLRADRLGAYGHAAPTSPTLDRLAAEGLLFTRAYSTTSWTLPSHAAMLTGLDDYAHGAYEARSPIARGVVPLAERLGAAGVESAGFFSGPFLHPSFGFGRGFGSYIDATSYGWQARGGIANVPHDASHADVTNPIVLEKVAAWLEARPAAGSARRTFVFIHLWDVHYDYIAPARYVEIFDPDYSGTLSGENFLGNPRIRPDMSPRDLQHLLALYDAEIRYTDDTIARLLELFEARGMLEHGAVLVTADHGEEFFDHGGKGHGLTLHDEVLRVPMILWLHGLPPARARTDRVVSLIDVAPTVCALFAVDCGYRGPGQSLLPLYLEESPAPGREDALAELTNPRFKLDLTARVDPAGKILRENRSGHVTYEPAPGPGKPGKPIRVNRKRLDHYPDDVRRSLELVQVRSARARREGAKIRHAGPAGEGPIDPRTLEQLEAIGYLEPEADAGTPAPGGAAPPPAPEEAR